MSAIYQDPNQPIPARVDDLLQRMTLPEKVAQLCAQWLLLDEQGEHQDRGLEFSQGEPRPPLGERLQNGVGQITRPLGTHTVDAEPGIRALNSLQRSMMEQTRLQIPVMSHEESLVGLMVKGATLFPSALNYGHTWNPALIRNAAEQIGIEARSIGAHQVLAPVLDVSRDVRWGRTEETFGEDPYLCGLMACAYVDGIQGEERDMLATLKHYVGHSFSEGARNHAPVHIGFRELNDQFMLPFEMAVKLTNAGSVMPAYHDIDNEPCHASYHLLTEVLRNEWGFDGLIVADYGGVELLQVHHSIASDLAEAAALAFNAGLDVELPDDKASLHLIDAMNRGLIAQSTIDAAVRRVLKMKFELGLFELPYGECNPNLNSEEAKQLAYQVASESVVLLENRDGLLPLSPSQHVALIGPTADDPLALLGGYSFPVHLIFVSQGDEVSAQCQSIKDQLNNRFEQLEFSKGCDILSERLANAPVFPGDVDMAMGQQTVSPVSTDTSQIKAAVEAARRADVAVVCVGDLAGLFQTGTVGEGSDTDSLNLPGVQQQLLDAVLDTGKPTVIIMTGGRPYNLQGAEKRCAAFLSAWAPGQEGARAITDILLGDTSPSGRLSLSFPKSAGAVPYYYNHKLKSAGTPIAYHFGSSYNFGYGLSYSEFDYTNLAIASREVDIAGEIEISLDVANVGKIEAAEVVQLYVRDEVATQVRPIRELKGFHKLWLRPDETRKVTFRLPVDMLNFTDSNHRRVVEPGTFSLMVGRSSSDICFSETVEVTGEKRTLPKYWRMCCDSADATIE